MIAEIEITQIVRSLIKSHFIAVLYCLTTNIFPLLKLSHNGVGLSVEQVAQALGLDVEAVRLVAQNQSAPGDVV